MKNILLSIALLLAASAALAKDPCLPSAPNAGPCMKTPPLTGPSCSQWLVCAFSSVPNGIPGIPAGHYVGVELVDGGGARYNVKPTEQVQYTLKYSGGCEANGGAMNVQLGGNGYVRLEDRPWNAACTNLVPLTFRAGIGGESFCGCKLPIPAPASGPDTCRQGYVWREACGPGDHVCVTPATRTETLRENQFASTRIAPPPKNIAGRGVSAPSDACQSGYVWREACGPRDHVCVTPAARQRARDDNAASGGRVAHFLGQ